LFLLGFIPPLWAGVVKTPFLNARFPSASQNERLNLIGKLPLSFEMNEGQADSGVSFFSRGPGYGIFFSPDKVRLVLHYALTQSKLEIPVFHKNPTNYGVDLINMELNNANINSNIEPMDKLPGVCNYFIGNDRTKWHTGIKLYSGVKLTNIYPGIDLKYYGNQGQLEHDFTVTPGVDPGIIQWKISGTENKNINESGDLVLKTPHGEVDWKSPQCYQWVDGQKQVVEGHYSLLPGDLIGFKIGIYRKDLPLVIDPYLVYSTYLGGSNRDSISGIAVDASGDAYVYGYTSSINFPTITGAFQTSLKGSSNLFVTEFNPSGSALIYSTYIGGSGIDISYGMVLDGSNNVYITGQTDSPDFPMVNAYQTTTGGVFVSEVNPTGNGLVYSTYLGGGGDIGYGIAVDGTGSAYVTGLTKSTTFPTVNPFQAAFAGSIGNAFITKFSPGGNTLDYSTYLGGSLGGSLGTGDAGSAIAVDGTGAAYITGSTKSTNFPTLNPYQATLNGSQNAFVTKINPVGNTLAYSTYLGGNNGSVLGLSGNSIAVDSSGCAYVTGSTNATDFPILNAFQSANGGGGTDAFLTKFNPAGNSVAFSTYLGGNGDDIGFGIALDPSNDIYLAVYTSSTNMPMVNPIQSTLPGSGSIFVGEFTPTASSLIYSTYWGGSSYDEPDAIALDNSGDAYVAGTMIGGTFPTVNPYQASYGGGVWDGFVFEIANGPTRTPTLSPTYTQSPTSTATWTITSTPTATSTSTPTPTISSTSTQTDSPTDTQTSTYTGTFTPSNTQTETLTFSMTPTPTVTPTQTQTFTLTLSPTYTNTPSITNTPTTTSTDTITNTPSCTPTYSMTFTSTVSMTPTPSFTASSTASPTSTITFTFSPTISFTPTPTPTVIVTEVTFEAPYPNPSLNGGPVTTDVLAPPGSTVEWAVFTIAFRKILDKTIVVPGQNATLVWNQEDMGGRRVANGLYYLRVQVMGPLYATKIWKLIVIR